MAKPNRCACGRMPHTVARDTADGTVTTRVACPSLTCEAWGPAVEDFERNDEAATELWNLHGGRKAA